MAEWYRQLKAGSPAPIVVALFHPAAMTWDHLPGEGKVAEVSALLSRHSRRTILDEISKSELVCANCHAVRTFRGSGT
jgi:hypothetical protein